MVTKHVCFAAEVAFQNGGLEAKAFPRSSGRNYQDLICKLHKIYVFEVKDAFSRILAAVGQWKF